MKRRGGPANGRAVALGGCALLALAASGATPASAQSAAPELINIDVPMLPDGVLMFVHPASMGSIAASIVVTDGFDNVVPGNIEFPSLEGMPIPQPSPSIWFWRPQAPLATGKRFKVDTSDDSTGEARSFVIETLAGPTDRAIDPDWLKLELRANALDRGEHTACCESEDLPSRCFAPNLVKLPELAVTVDASESSPVLRQLLFQISSDVSEHAVLWHGGNTPLPVVTFPDTRDEYCVQILVYDAVTPQQIVLPERCVPNQPELFEGTVPKEPDKIAVALGASWCQRPPEGYEADWCEANKDTCFPVDWPGCESFGELCPDYPRSSDAPSEPDTAVDADSGTGSDAGPAATGGGGSGCACSLGAHNATRARSPLTLAALALLALVRRATRS